MNTQIRLPYGKEHIAIEIPQEELKDVVESGLYSYAPGKSQEDVIKEALKHPYDSPELENLARNAETVVIITSDHTRPMPSRLTMPLRLKRWGTLLFSM